MVWSVTPIAQALAAENRVLVLGGMAVIFHGLSRLTKDIAVWLEPQADITEWSARLTSVVSRFPAAYFWDLATGEQIDPSAVAQCVEASGVVRVREGAHDLDIFRVPTNLQITDFDAAWRASVEMPAELMRALAPPWLLAVGTERQQDQSDVAYLEAKIRTETAPILRECSPAEAEALLEKYCDHETCRAALANPNAEVRALAISLLRRLSADQNPFAREILLEAGESGD